MQSLVILHCVGFFKNLIGLSYLHHVRSDGCGSSSKKPWSISS
jgi:hypothetical protein